MRGGAEEAAQAELGQQSLSVSRRSGGTAQALDCHPHQSTRTQDSTEPLRRPCQEPETEKTQREERHLLKHGQHFIQHMSNLPMPPIQLLNLPGSLAQLRNLAKLTDWLQP